MQLKLKNDHPLIRVFLLTLAKNMGIIAFMQFPLNGRGVQVIRENQDILSEKQSLPERGQWKSKPTLWVLVDQEFVEMIVYGR